MRKAPPVPRDHKAHKVVKVHKALKVLVPRGHRGRKVR